MVTCLSPVPVTLGRPISSRQVPTGDPRALPSRRRAYRSLSSHIGELRVRYRRCRGTCGTGLKGTSPPENAALLGGPVAYGDRRRERPIPDLGNGAHGQRLVKGPWIAEEPQATSLPSGMYPTGPLPPGGARPASAALSSGEAILSGCVPHVPTQKGSEPAARRCGRPENLQPAGT